jgi:hypothetical protein
MKRFSLILPLLALLASCVPKERFWWSPDGTQAVVATDDGLCLTQADGTLSAPLPGLDQKDALMQNVCWVPDGSGFLCIRKNKVSQWAEVTKSVAEEEVQAVDKLMPAIPYMIQGALLLAPEANNLEELAAAIPSEKPSVFVHAMARYLETEPRAAEALKKSDMRYTLYEICLQRLKPAPVLEVVCSSLSDVMIMPLISPNGVALAYLKLDERTEALSLEVRSLIDPQQKVSIPKTATSGFDWTPDGRSLVFMSPLGDGDGPLLSIQRCRVSDDQGGLMAQDKVELETLAAGLCGSTERLKVLPDGRILFASQPVTLPALQPKSQVDSQLYLLSADGSEIKPLPVAPGSLPAFPDNFALSPDGKRLALVESEITAVAVVEIESGKTTLIAEPQAPWKCSTLPAWRSSSELGFAGLHKGKPHWMLWSAEAGTRCLSEKWPAEVTAEWLAKPKE